MIIDDMSIEDVRAVINRDVIGKIKADHDLFGHWYVLPNGKRVASVTAKISVPAPHLLRWYGRMAIEAMEPLWQTVTPENREQILSHASLAGERTRDDAGHVGSIGHDAIEGWINAFKLDWASRTSIIPFVRPDAKTGTIDPRAVAVARSAEKFFVENAHYVPVVSELLVGDGKLGIAGTLDVLLYDTRTCSVIVGDWKSSNNVNDSYVMQVAAYRHCFERMTGLKTDRKCLILKLSKQYDKYETYIFRKPAKAFQMYRHSAALYDWLMDGTKKLVLDKKIIKA